MALRPPEGRRSGAGWGAGLPHRAPRCRPGGSGDGRRRRRAGLSPGKATEAGRATHSTRSSGRWGAARARKRCRGTPEGRPGGRTGTWGVPRWWRRRKPCIRKQGGRAPVPAAAGRRPWWTGVGRRGLTRRWGPLGERSCEFKMSGTASSACARACRRPRLRPLRSSSPPCPSFPPCRTLRRTRPWPGRNRATSMAQTKRRREGTETFRA